MSKIFGIGWAKTGTTTLGDCFKLLGFNHQSQALGLVKDITTKDLSRILQVVEQKDTFEDWPWILLYRELDEAFPGSRFVLTTRDSSKWIKSYKNMLCNEGVASEPLNKIRSTLYGLPFPNVSADMLIKRYEEHNKEVLDYFAERPTDLCVVDWEKGDDWNKLCSFLRMSVPDKPFPHSNRGVYTRIKPPFSRLLAGRLKRTR